MVESGDRRILFFKKISYSYIVFSVMAFLFLKGNIKQYTVECIFGGQREQSSNLHAQERLEVRILEEDGLKGQCILPSLPPIDEGRIPALDFWGWLNKQH